MLLTMLGLWKRSSSLWPKAGDDHWSLWSRPPALSFGPLEEVISSRHPLEGLLQVGADINTSRNNHPPHWPQWSSLHREQLSSPLFAWKQTTKTDFGSGKQMAANCAVSVPWDKHFWGKSHPGHQVIVEKLRQGPCPPGAHSLMRSETYKKTFITPQFTLGDEEHRAISSALVIWEGLQGEAGAELNPRAGDLRDNAKWEKVWTACHQEVSVSWQLPGGCRDEQWQGDTVTRPLNGKSSKVSEELWQS